MAAVALPVIAHLMSRRVRRRVIFPTIRLLREAAATQSRIFRLRRWLLLALRCLAMVLIAWAFARPMWTDATAAVNGDESRAVVLILDVSASTAQRQGGVRAIQRIGAAAQRVLDGLEPGGDAANIVYAAVRPRGAYPKLIANLDALRQEAGAAAATQERADLGAALALAAAMLEDHGGLRRIVLISDMQETNWTDLRPALDETRRTAEVTILPIPDHPAANTGITEYAIHPARPITGQPATISATLRNHALHDRDIRITLRVEGREAGVETLSLPADGTGGVSFPVTFDSPGHQRVEWRVSEDDLDRDDRVFMAVEVVERGVVLLVSDDDAARPTGSGYFITRALAPAGDERDSIDIRNVRPSALTVTDLSEAEAVLIADAGPLPAGAVEALVAHVERGGGVMMFIGGAASLNAAALERAAGERGMIPFQPLHADRSDPRQRAWWLDEGAWAAAPLDRFDESARLALLEIPFARRDVTGQAAEEAFIMLRYADRTPALGAMHFGRGRFVLVNFTPAPAGGDLPKHGVFVALMHELVNYVRPQDEMAGQRMVGQAITFELPGAPPSLRVTDPDGREIAVDLAPLEGGLAVHTAPAEQAGFYSLLSGGDVLKRVAVNIDPRESDLRTISPEALRVSDDDVRVARTPADGFGKPVEERNRPLWWWFVLAAACVVGLELVLIGVWRR